MSSNSCTKRNLGCILNNENAPHEDEIIFKVLRPSLALSLFNTDNFNFINADAEISQDGSKVTCKKSTMYNVACQSISPYVSSMENMLEINLDDLQYCQNLRVINANQQVIRQSFRNIPSTVTHLMAGNATVDIEDIGHITSLTDLVITQASGMYIKGNLEDFVAMQIEAGRISCQRLTLGWRNVPSAVIYSGIKFNNIPITVLSDVSWNWDGTNYNIVVTPE